MPAPRKRLDWLVQDGRVCKSDLRLIRKAIRERWPMSSRTKRALASKLFKALCPPDVPHRSVIALATTLMEMDRAALDAEAARLKGEWEGLRAQIDASGLRRPPNPPGDSGGSRGAV